MASQAVSNSNDQARIRASWCASLMAGLAELSELEQAEIAAEIGDTIADAIAEAGEIGWIPGATFAALLDAIVTAVGDERWFELCRATLLGSSRSPLLRRTSDGAVRLFGPTGVVLAAVPAWDLVTRGCADIHAHEVAGPAAGVQAVAVEFTAIPEPFASSWAWVALCRAWLQASLDGSGLPGVVEQRQSPNSKSLRFRVHIAGEQRSLG